MIPFQGGNIMQGRLFVGWLFVGGLVLGLANVAQGQVVLEAALESVDDDVVASLEDRYGEYEPVSLTTESGPILLSQIEDWVQPPGQAPSASVTVNEPLSTPTPLSAPIQLQYAPTPSQLAPIQSVPGPVYYDVPQPMPMPRRTCPPWRPCGPQESYGGNWFFKQGFAGADFRGACDFHDRCLMDGCTDRKTCDKKFLAYLDNACNCSQFPVLCRIKAREFYLGVRLFGWLY